MEIWISNEQAKVALVPEQEDLIRQVVVGTLRQAGSQLGDNVEVSVSLVDNETIQKLNREHRGIDRATDVLSFAQLEGEEFAALPEETPLPIGDVVVSLERCLEQAADYDHSFDRELGFLVAHGVLHLLGFDHQTPEEEADMMTRSEEILGELGLKRT